MYDGRTRKCWYALLACILNPRLSVSKGIELFGLAESCRSDSDEYTITERKRAWWREYYEQNRDQVIARNRRYRERVRGR